ncbi:glutathione S-transferase [Ceratobasidium sp. AG-I]|nr:glutathione S-transferase [Ceratobasidium sp. AG-I]
MFLVRRSLLPRTCALPVKTLVAPPRFYSMSTDKSEAQKDITKWASTDGHFRRQVSSFRDVIEEGGKFEPEKDRYHVFVSYACPWAHRVLITRALLKLDNIIGLSVVSPRMGSLGWPFAAADEFPGADKDPVQNSNHVRDLYFKADSEYSGRFTVPIVWDKKTSTIVNNESSEIIRFLNSSFRKLAEPVDIDIYPEPLRKDIDEFHSWVYDTVNNGVYKCGFATTQEAYEAAVGPLFASLDRLEKLIKGKDYFFGDRLTEADIRLYTTIVRFDPVYHGHFKCNLGSIRHNYPEINRWMKNLYWNVPAFKDTTNFEHIKTHYYWSHTQINPTRIVPQGPNTNIEPL